jgi:hypothetical protein
VSRLYVVVKSYRSFLGVGVTGVAEPVDCRGVVGIVVGREKAEGGALEPVGYLFDVADQLDT